MNVNFVALAQSFSMQSTANVCIKFLHSKLKFSSNRNNRSLSFRPKFIPCEISFIFTENIQKARISPKFVSILCTLLHYIDISLMDLVMRAVQERMHKSALVCINIFFTLQNVASVKPTDPSSRTASVVF